jgi:hypothetical protein
VIPSLLIGVPAAFRKQAVDIGQRAVATNEEPQPFGVRLARPAPVPRLTARVARVEPDAPQRLPAAMRASLNIAPVLMLPADGHATVGAMIFHRARLRRCVRIGTTLSVGGALTIRLTSFATGCNAASIIGLFAGIVIVPPDVFDGVAVRHFSRQ